MGFLIFLFFVLFPVAEIMVLGRVAARIGFWDTLILLIFSGVFGAYLAKLQGKATLIRVQQALAEGRAPTVEMLDGLMIFLGGVLFIIPGFLSDVLGLLLIFPVTRWVLKRFFLGNIKFAYEKRGARRPQDGAKASQESGGFRGNAQDAEIVEG